MKTKYSFITVVLIVGLLAVLIAPMAISAQRAQAQGPGIGNLIAFVSDRDGNAEIYVMNVDGSNQTNLTNNSAHDGFPAWSPDGTQIVFESNRDGNAEVYLMNVDGSGLTRLTNNSTDDRWPSWSPDGTQIVFSRWHDDGGQWEIYVMNTDGSGQTRLTNIFSEEATPVWSPDGAQIAFHSNRDGQWEIYVMNPDGSGQTRLTNSPEIDAHPAWSPDSAQIAFYTYPDLGSPSVVDIFVMNRDGSNIVQITDNPGIDAHPSWSPDGTQIVFYSDQHGPVWDLYIMNADGSYQTRIMGDGHDYDPVWQPFTSGCRTNAPGTVTQGDIFTLTLRCDGIAENVFGFQAGHEITAGAGLVTEQASSYTAGTIFDGEPTLAGPNTLPLYALALQAGGTEATGSFTLGLVDYSADVPGEATFDLINLILGDINGEAIPDVVAAVTATTVTIKDLILSLSGTVDPEGYAHANDLVFTLEGSPAYSALTTTFDPADNTTDFTFTNIQGQPAWLRVDGPSHVTCEQTLTFPSDAGNEVLPDPLVLLAGDVNSDDAVDIIDAAAIGLEYGNAASGELDINGDGTINILDLIHVGRNYGTVGPTVCAP